MSRRRSSLVLTIVSTAVAVLGVACDRDGAGPSPSASGTDAASATRSAGASSAPALFGPAPAAASSLRPDTSLGTPRRSRYVSFDDSALPATADGSRLRLDFFDDAVFTARIEHLDRQPLLTSWSGPIEGMAHSDVVITFAAGRYQVTASTERGSFTMSMTRSGIYQVEEVDGSPPIDSGAARP